MGKQLGKEIMPQVLELKKQGYTLQMIGYKFGYTKKQIKNLLYRQRKSKSGIISIPRKRGRPRKRPLSTEEEYQQRIKQLEMENDLLRSFFKLLEGCESRDQVCCDRKISRQISRENNVFFLSGFSKRLLCASWKKRKQDRRRPCATHTPMSRRNGSYLWLSANWTVA